MESVTTIYINSKDRETGSISNFRYTLTNGINNCKGYYIKYATIPFSQYVSLYKPKTGNTINLNFSDAGGSYILHLGPPGNYTANQLATLLQSALNAASSYQVYSVSYNVNTYQFTISVPTVIGASGFTIDFSSANTSPGQNPSYSFGFQPVSSSSTGSTPYVLVSTQAANLNGPSLNYYIRSSSFTSDGSYSYFENQKDVVICQIPINVAPSGVLTFEDEIGEFIPLRNINMSYISVELIDDYGNNIDTNGLDWELTYVVKNKSY
jgi:hypothetical protein